MLGKVSNLLSRTKLLIVSALSWDGSVIILKLRRSRRWSDFVCASTI